MKFTEQILNRSCEHFLKSVDVRPKKRTFFNNPNQSLAPSFKCLSSSTSSEKPALVKISKMLILGPKTPHLPHSGYNKNFSQKIVTRNFL